ncbi:hypothetical protein PMIN01_02080 [Paraphaeosphaeria minitans]|uniref:Uncharacterized protein n=1 Tax=Paraphaeosphaeria minitans TaxID=565426 RepID=A0A9P6GPH2_9PLEO|nr:hypothetical protein PMIN01_02080 [Paraphaeosphaeria minitans]
MCYFEKIHFVPCGHNDIRLIQHCHFARNDPNHQCFGSWNIKREWEQHESKCQKCIAARPAVQYSNTNTQCGLTSSR